MPWGGVHALEGSADPSVGGGLAGSSRLLALEGVLATDLAATGADLGHVLAVLADRLAAKPAGTTRLLSAELMGGALHMRGLAAFARDRALLVFAHRREAASFLEEVHGICS